MSAHRVAVFLPADFSLFEVAVAVEVFGVRRPEIEVEWYDVKLCTVEPGPATAHGDLLGAIVPHGLEAIDAADTVIVPRCATQESPADERALAAIRRAHFRGARLASFCDGAFVLAAAGVLDGRKATTHWKYAERLAAEYPRVQVSPEVLYVDEGQVLTAAGTASGVDLALHMVRADHGAHVARQVARSMVVPPHRDGGQAQFVMSAVPDGGETEDGVHRALAYMSHHLDSEYSLTDMAKLAFMSTRNFSRRFREATGTTPGRWLLHQRLTRARELLEETDLPIERIAQITGFGSAVTFRQRFAQSLKTSPTTYRRAFRGLSEANSVSLEDESSELRTLRVV
jgi:AraC family transcriptional regulator, transcriptional activator FtrA